jgi:hypothetical protein
MLWCSDCDGENPTPAELDQHDTREAAWLTRLSTRSRFRVFAQDFLGARRPFPVVNARHNGRPVFRLALRQAAEFLSKKDYADNWKSEMNEEFCFWGFNRWKSVLSEVGFHVLENPNQPAEGSRVYTNPWIVEHRYVGRVEITDLDGHPLPWPPTNMVLAAEKASAPDQGSLE